MKKAREIKVPMNIAVMDAGGNLKAFARMDDAFIGSIDIAQKKAKTARYFNMSTRDLGKASQPGGELYGIEVTNDGLVIFPGGVLLVDKNGVIVGSVGVSGGSVDEDESVAKAGAAALPARPRDVPLSAILPCHRDSLRTRARLGAHDVVLADPGDLAVRADPDRLNQILTNVLSNAVRHGAPPIHVTAWADGDEVVIEVRDHGPGITPEHARLAFVRQWRAGPYAGAGIGLHLTQALVAAHGGSVEFVPVDGPGAAVQVRLPRS